MESLKLAGILSKTVTIYSLKSQAETELTPRLSTHHRIPVSKEIIRQVFSTCIKHEFKVAIQVLTVSNQFVKGSTIFSLFFSKFQLAALKLRSSHLEAAWPLSSAFAAPSQNPVSEDRWPQSWTSPSAPYRSTWSCLVRYNPFLN